METSKVVLLIVGPTGIGKTAVSVEIAKEIDCEVVSADSRQLYKYMDIGTAKPTNDELAAVPHHFIDHKTPDQYYSAGEFGEEARRCIEDIFRRHKQPVVVGGSGLYIRALVDGFFGPQIADDEIKQNLRKQVDSSGLAALYNKLQSVDPAAAAQLNPADSQRILRALEVFEITGKRWSEFLQEESKPASFQPLFVGLKMERKKLYERIERRVDVMIAQGLIEEVRHLKRLGYEPEINALRTVGYRETFQYLNGELDETEMIERIKQKSRNYAKRQLTWFRSDERINWFDLDDFLSLNQLAGTVLALLETTRPKAVRFDLTF